MEEGGGRGKGETHPWFWGEKVMILFPCPQRPGCKTSTKTIKLLGRLSFPDRWKGSRLLVLPDCFGDQIQSTRANGNRWDWGNNENSCHLRNNVPPRPQIFSRLLGFHPNGLMATKDLQTCLLCFALSI